MPTSSPDAPLTILYRDEDLVAVHKPAGLLVHRTTIDARDSRALLQRLRDQIGVAVYPAHRLDKATSGVVLFALHAAAARQLAAVLREGEAEKTYVAIVRGWAGEASDVDHPLRDRPDRLARRQVVESRPAFTAVRCLARAELDVAVGRYATARYSCVACLPRTGRQHQIRRHLKHLRHPVIGDANYGDGAHNRFFRHRLGIARLLLAAVAIRLPHPRSGAALAIEAPLDAEFHAVLAWPQWRALAATTADAAPLAAALRAVVAPAER
jgi:tRNA pseudouridine65 synthase